MFWTSNQTQQWQAPRLHISHTTWEREIYLAFYHFSISTFRRLLPKGLVVFCCLFFVCFFNKTTFNSFFKAAHHMSNSDLCWWCSKQNSDSYNLRLGMKLFHCKNKSNDDVWENVMFCNTTSHSKTTLHLPWREPLRYSKSTCQYQDIKLKNNTIEQSRTLLRLNCKVFGCKIWKTKNFDFLRTKSCINTHNDKFLQWIYLIAIQYVSWIYLLQL